MVYLKSVENVITLGKLIGLLFLFCLPLLSMKTKRNDLARPVVGTIFLVLEELIRRERRDGGEGEERGSRKGEIEIETKETKGN